MRTVFTDLFWTFSGVVYQKAGFLTAFWLANAHGFVKCMVFTYFLHGQLGQLGQLGQARFIGCNRSTQLDWQMHKTCFLINSTLLDHSYFAQTNSTARRFMSSFTVTYFWVVDMLRWPERLANTNTLIPCDASDVMNVLRPLWLLAPATPARLYK